MEKDYVYKLEFEDCEGNVYIFDYTTCEEDLHYYLTEYFGLWCTLYQFARIEKSLQKMWVDEVTESTLFTDGYFELEF